MAKNINAAGMIGRVIVASQWLQAPLYFGLIVAQAIYVYQFCLELYHLVHGLGKLTEQDIMLMVLGLIDVVMISNLLIMVIIGGYHTFVERIHFSERNPPEWLSHINASTMKVKLSMALIGISSIHLLKSFIEIEKLQKCDVYAQMAIHMLFIISAIGLAHIAKITEPHSNNHTPEHASEQPEKQPQE